jgi:tetratricopeptide (TPR) repeat protein
MNSVSNKAGGLPESKRRGYSIEEIDAIYDLGRLYLTSGNLQAAENIMQGLVSVVPDYAPAWLGLSYINGMNHNHDAALFAARQAVRIDATATEAQLYLISCLLTVEDFNTAGTYLGEVGDKIDSGTVDNSYLVRFFKAQLVRYHNR